MADVSLVGEPASEETPRYGKVPHESCDVGKGAFPHPGCGGEARLFMITVDEGWRMSILCMGMYESQADWLLRQLAHRPRYSSLAIGLAES